jgi:NAD(P)-dependent dehydrogenase (short-subunit alcohol dehydrogenase family)
MAGTEQTGSTGTPRGAAVVTGGGSGIGRATVLRLLADGRPVVVADVHEANAAATAELAARAGHGERVAAVRADVREEGDVAAAVEVAVRRFGALGVMVNNAGVGGAFGPVTEIAAEDFDFTFEVLVRGVFFGVKHAVRALRAQGVPGSIVNVASVAAAGGGKGPPVYSAAKAAVVNLTTALATELAPDRIRVNAVSPGAILTPLLAAGEPTDATRDLLTAAQPWPEHGRPEHIAAAIAYLAGPDAEFVTGQNLVVDGGLLAAGPGRAFADALGVDPGTRGLTGVSYGSTGRAPVIHTRPGG